MTVADQPEIIKVAQEIEQQWTNLGVATNLQIVSNFDLPKNVINTRSYQALITSLVTGPDPDPYPVWHSSQATPPGLNLSVFQNNEADKLLTAARATTDINLRSTSYSRWQSIINNEVPAVFLYSTDYNYIISRQINGPQSVELSQPS